MSKVKTGITLFSLGTPYLKGELDLEGVIRTAAELGAEGYEIVATQMIPTRLSRMNSWNLSTNARRNMASDRSAIRQIWIGEC